MLIVLTLAVAAAAVANVFGQEPVSSTAEGRSASLAIQAPDRLRGGLLYQVRLTVAAHRRIAEPTFVLDQGWLDQMTLNGVAPQPASSGSAAGRLTMRFPALAAGKRLVVWLYFQANPTASGIRHPHAELRDGARTLASIDRTLVVFP